MEDDESHHFSCAAHCLMLISSDFNMSNWIWMGFAYAQPMSPLVISRHPQSYQGIRIGFCYNRLASIMTKKMLLLDVEKTCNVNLTASSKQLTRELIMYPCWKLQFSMRRSSSQLIHPIVALDAIRSLMHIRKHESIVD